MTEGLQRIPREAQTLGELTIALNNALAHSILENVEYLLKLQFALAKATTRDRHAAVAQWLAAHSQQERVHAGIEHAQTYAQKALASGAMLTEIISAFYQETQVHLLKASQAAMMIAKESDRTLDRR